MKGMMKNRAIALHRYPESLLWQPSTMKLVPSVLIATLAGLGLASPAIAQFSIWGDDGFDIFFNTPRRQLIETGQCPRCHLRFLDLPEADLPNADLTAADLEEANLSGSDLRNASFRQADLENINLQDANLEGASFRDADLEDANLSGANLRLVYLAGANLAGANLTGADLSLVNLDTASYCQTIMPDGSVRNDDCGGQRAEGEDWREG